MIYPHFSNATTTIPVVGPQRPGDPVTLSERQQHMIEQARSAREQLFKDAHALMSELDAAGWSHVTWFDSLGSEWDSSDMQLYVAMQYLAALPERKPLSPEFQFMAQCYLP